MLRWGYVLSISWFIFASNVYSSTLFTKNTSRFSQIASFPVLNCVEVIWWQIDETSQIWCCVNYLSITKKCLTISFLSTFCMCFYPEQSFDQINTLLLMIFCTLAITEIANNKLDRDKWMDSESKLNYIKVIFIKTTSLRMEENNFY